MNENMNEAVEKTTEEIIQESSRKGSGKAVLAILAIGAIASFGGVVIHRYIKKKKYVEASPDEECVVETDSAEVDEEESQN